MDNSYKGIFQRGTAVVAFLLPLKLSLTYIALTPLILLFLLRGSSAAARDIIAKTNSEKPNIASALLAPLILFFGASLLSAMVGVAPLRSLSSLSSLIFFSTTIALFAFYARPLTTCLCLVAGQSIAGLHTVLEAAFPDLFTKLFLGKVTESGQLAVTLFIALGICWGRWVPCDPDSDNKGRRLRFLLLSLCAILTLLFTMIGFQRDLKLSTVVLTPLAIFAFILSIAIGRYLEIIRFNAANKTVAFIATFSAPLMISSLLLNLKRGPWLGVFIGLTAYAVVFARRLIAPLAIAACTLAISVPPLRERILDSYQHFTIQGGRSTIWRIGAELLLQFPLGVGYHNSGILREFAPEIPKELKHFHNNLINIGAETGWLGVLLFIWFIFGVLRLSFGNRRDPLCVAIGCGVLSWQVAGLGEYNFGDSEVTILVWMMLGILIQKATVSGTSQTLRVP